LYKKLKIRAQKTQVEEFFGSELSSSCPNIDKI